MLDTNLLRESIFGMDIYLLDQLMKGRLEGIGNLLEVGCGAGRNLRFFLRAGISVTGVDENPQAIQKAREFAGNIATNQGVSRFQVASAGALPFADGSFDAVLSIAVLHFVTGKAQFLGQLEELWRVLRAGGMLFARLASKTGLEDKIRPVGAESFQLPDGSTRYLVDHQFLLDCGTRLGGELLDPIKTTNVQDRRCMTTWCLRKPGNDHPR